jgi:hypothetical protein
LQFFDLRDVQYGAINAALGYAFIVQVQTDLDFGLGDEGRVMVWNLITFSATQP